MKKIHAAPSYHRLRISIALGVLWAFLHYVRIPLPGIGIPVIVQPFGAYFSGILVGPWYGLLSQLVFVALLPFTAFAHIGGARILWGPHAGYIWGIVAMGFFSGIIARQRWKFNQTVSALVGATFCIIHLPGMGFLRWWHTANHQVAPDWPSLLSTTMFVFVIGNVVKASIALFLAGYHQFVSERNVVPVTPKRSRLKE